MIFTTTETLSYYSSLVKTQRRDWFLAAMFLPASMREVVIAIYALDIELAHVHHVVKEEMMGHIRYAWWQENIEGLHNGVVNEHPVLQALANINIPQESLLSIVTAYRESFPEHPPEIENIVQNIIKDYLDSCHTELVEVSLQSNDKTSRQARGDKNKWKKSTAIISNHRKKYGAKLENWLLVKLLFV